MPHCTFEYSANLEIESKLTLFLSDLHGELMKTGVFELRQIKSRAAKRDYFLVGDGNSKNAFIYLEIAILDGRTLEKRQEIGKRAYDLVLRSFAEAIQSHNCSVGIEVREIERERYVSASLRAI